MLGKRRTIPVIGNLTSSFISGNRAADVSSPREFKIQSPRGSLKSHYDAGGVGLGIVAALEKSAQDHHHTTNRSVSRSNPIPVHSARIRSRGFEEDEMDRLEDYTFVTCHRPGNESFTRVYYDGGYVNQQRGPKASEVDRRSSNSRRPSMFTLSSPARIGDFAAVPDSDFLSACNLCHKKLQGRDIYMYRGEKAFCSTECRDSQILMDEQKENGKAHQRSLDHVSNSAYKKKNGYGQILSPGIFAI